MRGVFAGSVARATGMILLTVSCVQMLLCLACTLHIVGPVQHESNNLFSRSGLTSIIFRRQAASCPCGWLGKEKTIFGDSGVGFGHESASNCEQCTSSFDLTAEAPNCAASSLIGIASHKPVTRH